MSFNLFYLAFFLSNLVVFFRCDDFYEFACGTFLKVSVD
jgi:hypothetical protein